MLLRALVPVVVGALVLIATAIGAAALSWSGTWAGHGEIVKGIPICAGGGSDVGCQSRSVLASSSFRLTFTKSAVAYYGEGPTGASHDSPSAKGWCRMRLTVERVSRGWTYYNPAGRAKSAGEGGPGVPCGTGLRIHQAGAKLRVEFGYDHNPSNDFSSYTYLSRSS